MFKAAVSLWDQFIVRFGVDNVIWKTLLFIIVSVHVLHSVGVFYFKKLMQQAVI